jgi:hypothetical protein
VVDWPCQTRLVELVDRDGYLAVVCTMLDHATPLGPGPEPDGPGLAALHRELAANAPFAGIGSSLAGTPGDRNVELRVTPPFPLARLTST